MHDNDMKTTKEIQISPSKNLTIPVIFISKRQPYPVGKIIKTTVCRSAFLLIRH